MKISDSYLKKNKSYGFVKNGLLYSDKANIINMRLTFTMMLYN